MTRRLTPMSAVTIASAIVAAGLAQSGVATSVAAQEWVDGACTDNVGVTVVVDFHELGGGVNVRCARGPASNGLDALDRADVAWEGTLRFPGFVCRIAGLPTPANDACANTPPADAFWSYWIAPRGGDWCYSDIGPASRRPPAGSIEGWSFALDKAATNIPPPRFEVPGAVPGQAPNPVRGSECTTAVASNASDSTVRPTSTSSTTTSTSASTSSSTSTTVSRTSPPTPRSGEVAEIDAEIDAEVDAEVAGDVAGSTTMVATTSSVPSPTSTRVAASSGAEATDSTGSTQPDDGDDSDDSDGGDDVEVGAAKNEPPPSLFEVSERTAEGTVKGAGAELGTVDLSDDRRGGGGFGLSSVLAIAAIAGVATAGVLAARRRSRPLRIET